MKNFAFSTLTLAAVLSVSAFFTQAIAAQTKMKPALCKVRKNNTIFFLSATEKEMKLKKGTPISWSVPDMHQGLIVVKAKVGKKWIQGEILLDDTTCN